MELKLIHQGKVRDLYAAGEKYLLIVSSDRISAFDFILPTPVPGKGALLNKISSFWFDRTSHIIKNHIVSTDIDEIRRLVAAPAGFDWDYMRGRSMLVHRTKRVDFECVVRGYITGSGWKEYLKQGSVCGIKLPAGLKEAQKLPEPIFTPTTKADQGHDENVTFAQMAAALPPGLAEKVRDTSLALYKFAAAHAEKAGILLADTKFEFGLLGDELLLIDEVLTPDSSRFWPADQYRPGRSQKSFDKQFVRDYLESIGFNKQPPAPKLPLEVIEGTRSRYLEALKRLSGRGLE